MPAGIGAGGVLTIVPEVTMGTFLDPSTAGAVQVPILNENLAYTETKYYSQQIRQNVIDSAVGAGPYHIAGDIVMEFDSTFVPWFLYATRHTATKTGTTPNFVYKFVPNTAGSAQISGTMKTYSITVERDGIGFGYAGCVLTGFEFTVTDGVLQFTAHVMGVSETTPAALSTPVYVTPKIMGANAINIFTGPAGVAPVFTQNLNFNGFTFSANHNADAQNRIQSQRAASYISYGKTDIEVTTELDFVTKTDYDAMKANTARAIRLEAVGDGQPYATSLDACRVDLNNSVFDTYEVGLSGMSDLIMANSTFHGLTQAGGSAYSIEIKSTAVIT